MSVSDLTVDQLKARAAELGVEVPAGAKKADIVALVEAAEAGTPQPSDAEAEPVTSGRFHVHLLAPTPLGKNPLIVDAANEADARAKFNAANGIQGSRQTYRIRKATAADEAEQKARDEAAPKPTPAPEPEPEEDE